MTPPCMHCGEEFDQHVVRGNERWCRFKFQISDEAAEFVKANLDKSDKELADLWIERVTTRKDP